MPSPKTERACEGCGNVYLMGPTQRWHSKKCHGDAVMRKPGKKFICANPECGIEYEKTVHQIGAGTGEFHTRRCANRARAIDELVRFERDAHGVGTEPLHKAGIGPCREWTGTPTKDGYGAFFLTNGKQIQAHIYSWQLVNGPVPTGKCVCHRCDNRPCLRNEPPGEFVLNGRTIPCSGHLFLGTRDENNEDMVDKDRQARGERMGLAKLTDAIVREARLLYKAGGISQQQLADRYGVAQPVMSAALRGKTWRHVI